MPDLNRRAFLAAGIAAPVAFANPPEPVKLPELSAPTERDRGAPPTPLSPDERVGVAVVGLGHLSLDEILPAFGASKYAKLTALVSGDAGKAGKVARQYGVPETSVYNYRTFDRLKDDKNVQFVYIVLPNGLHCEYTVRAAAAGKHVLCEKPMANSVKECEEMIAACDKAQRHLMIAYRCQYQPHHRALTEITRTQLGDVKFILADNGQNETTQLNWRHNKKLAGGGALPDVGIYCFNAARYLTGEEPVEVRATLFSTPNDPRFAEVEENVAFHLRFPSGVIAACTTGYGHHEVRRVRVVGAKGWAELDPGFPYRGLRLRTSFSQGKAELLTERLLAEPNQFALELDHMAQRVQANKRPYTPGEEGLQDQKVTDAIYRAAETGRPVALPKFDGRDLFRGPEPIEGA